MLKVPIKQQPDETTCGPTCLHSIYQFYENPINLNTVIGEVHQFEEGGTIGALLAIDALKKGYNATIFSYNLQIFDPTWFGLKSDVLIDKLNLQLKYKRSTKFRLASEAYIQFLELGGKLRFEDLRSVIIRRYLKKNQPIIAGLSATYLYKSAREYGPHLDYDDIRGEPAGHFVVLHGYDMETREVFIADPIKTNPMGNGQFYKMKIERVINAILLGIVTYDANLIIITPK
jgi:hypothetical protein